VAKHKGQPIYVVRPSWVRSEVVIGNISRRQMN